jgi:glyoxylase-like metal-dependent hydrolase (beta-lactamase superfamily II)
MNVKTFFDKATFTYTYVVYDYTTKDAIIIDPVLDYDAASSVYDFASVQSVYAFTKDQNLNVHYILETHAHADHLTGSQKLKEFYPKALVGIGENIDKVQDVFAKLFNINDLAKNSEDFDVLFKDNQEFHAGSIKVKVIATPGHTPACVSYLIEDMVFTGDSLFLPDYGTGRCDFPMGSSEDLYHSIKKLHTLPAQTRVFVGHDYGTSERDVAFETTIQASRENNIHINDKVSLEQFVEFRNNRDKTLAAPKLLLPSIQFNIRAGKFPKAEQNEMSYLKLPLRKKG